MNVNPTFAKFWSCRSVTHQVLLDRLTVNNVSVFVAYLAHLARLTPNQLTVISMLFAVLSFAAAIVLPADRPAFSILVVFALAEFSYLLDCADGQLARATDSASKFGAFLDKGVDKFNNILFLAAFFAYAFRHYVFTDDMGRAKVFLLVGFFLLISNTSRYIVRQYFLAMYEEKKEKSEDKDGLVMILMKNFMDIQFSLIIFILFIFWPLVSLSLFILQATLLIAAYFRYFPRARKADRAS